MITFAVCDDEPVFLDIMVEELNLTLKDTGYEYRILRFSCAQKLLAAEKSIDILLLDIHLGNEFDGISIGEELAKRESHPILILVSSYENRVFDGYRTKAHRFLAKPLCRKLFREAIHTAIEELQNPAMRLAIHYNQEVHWIEIQVIDYVERYDRKRCVYALGKVYYTYESWESLIARLPLGQFFEVQRAYCVNLGRIRTVKGNTITMLNGEQLTISRGRKEALDRALNHYARERKGHVFLPA